MYQYVCMWYWQQILTNIQSECQKDDWSSGFWLFLFEFEKFYY